MALHTRVKPGKEEEYDAAHRAVPLEVTDAILEAGVHEWTIYRDGLDLFHVVDCDDYARFLALLEPLPANIAWQARMGELLAVVHDYTAPDAGLPAVWHLTPDDHT